MDLACAHVHAYSRQLAKYRRFWIGFRQNRARSARSLKCLNEWRVPYASPMTTTLPQEPDWSAIQADWNQFKAHAKRRWDRIGEQQLHAIAGRRPLLAARIKEIYGLSNEDTEKQLTDWQSSLQRR